MKYIKLPVLKNKLSICMRKLIRYNDLGFVLNNLESTITLPIPSKKSGMQQEEYTNNKNLSLQVLKTFLDTYEKISEELKIRETTFGTIRALYPDFCADIKKSISPEQYSEYIELLKRLRVVLNAITLEKNTNASNSEELLFQKRDTVGRLIDSEIASRLGNIEDTFVLEELSRIDVTKFDETTRSNIENIKNAIISRIRIYEQYSRLYSVKEIRLTSGYNKEEGRNID